MIIIELLIEMIIIGKVFFFTFTNWARRDGTSRPIVSQLQLLLVLPVHGLTCYLYAFSPIDKARIVRAYT